MSDEDLVSAKNPSSPVETLRTLARDEDPDVRKAVAQNLNTPVEILTTLASDGDQYVRAAVAGNPNTPLEMLVVLTKDEHAGARAAVAGNPNTPVEILMALAKDGDVNVCIAIVRNPNTSLEILTTLARDGDENVRIAIASNPNIPEEILWFGLEELSSETSRESLLETIANSYAYGHESVLLAAANPILSALDLENLVLNVDDELWSLHPDDRNENSEEHATIWMLCGVACNPNLTNDIKNKLLRHHNPVALIRFFDQMTKADQDALPIFKDPILRSILGQNGEYEKIVTEAKSRSTNAKRLAEIYNLQLNELINRTTTFGMFGNYEDYEGTRERFIFGQNFYEINAKSREDSSSLSEVVEYFLATERRPEFSFLRSHVLSNPNFPATPIDNLVRDSESVVSWEDYLLQDHHPSLHSFLYVLPIGTGHDIDTHWWLAISKTINAMGTEEQLDQVAEIFESMSLVGCDYFDIEAQFDDYVSMIMPFLVGSSQKFLERSFDLDSFAIKQAILLNPSCTSVIQDRAWELNEAEDSSKSLHIPSCIELALYAAHLGKYELIEKWISTPEEIDAFIQACEPHIVDAIAELNLDSSSPSTQDDRETMLGTKEKAEIIFEFNNEYRGNEAFDDFFSFNDLGVPMAVMIVNDLIILTDEGLDVINETWKSLCEQLNDADPNYEYADLNDLVERNVPFEDPNDPEGIEG